MLWRIVIALCFVLQPLRVMASSSSAHFDIRVTSLEEGMRHNTVNIFATPGIGNYNNIEVYWKDESVYVSAPNNVLKLSYRRGLTLKERYRWQPTPRNVEECQKSGPGDCERNHIKILLLFNKTRSREDAIFICGTMGRQPECTERSTRNMTQALGLWGAEHRCPYNPDSSFTALMGSDGFLYLGMGVDAAERKFSFFRRNQTADSKRPELTIRMNDDRYLMEPVFVSSHEIGGYIYFFFHETSYESYSSCNLKIVVSRVARVCKNDPGSSSIWNRNEWTTYLKARMLCKGKNVKEDTYHQITSTYLDSRGGFIYAVFTSSDTGPPGSVLCRYHLSDLDVVFNSTYKVQHKIRREEWLHQENKGYMACPGPKDLHQAQRSTISSTYQMVSKDYRNDGVHPLFRDGERWTKVVKTTLRGLRARRHHILFIATNVGTILKIAKIKRYFCIVEIIEVEKDAVINDLALVTIRSTGENFLIATAAKKMVRLALHRCARYRTQALCIEARDPFCAWNLRNGTCTSVENLSKEIKNTRFRQKLNGCPNIRRPLDGMWAAWEPWRSCEKIAGPPRNRRKVGCRCRLRSCSQPPAVHGGAPCKGSAIQVTNCTVDGNWSPWSAWSQCSATCGYSRQYRFRRCDSPTPSSDGRGCRGPNEISRACSRPVCPPPTPTPVHGSWSAWSEWNTCSSPCLGGFRKRTRTCSNPAPENAGYPCYGASWDYSKCNEAPCPVVEKFSEWTSWIMEKQEDGTRFRKRRFRISCSAPLPDDSLLTTKVISEPCSNSRCSEDGGRSLPPSKGRKSPQRPHQKQPSSNPFKAPNPFDSPVMGNNVDGGWSIWSAWSVCSQTCGGGTSTRRRRCNAPTPQGKGQICIGEPTNQRPCNVGPCDRGQWSCWSDWSPCACSKNLRVRQRQCQTPDGLEAIKCPGSHQEEARCDPSHCFSDGWMPWTTWSACRSGLQKRTRQCRYEVPRPAKTEYCLGPSEEQKACDELTVGATRYNDQFTIYEVVIVGVLTFVIGGVGVGIIVMLCCHRKQRRLRRQLRSYRRRSRSAPTSDTLPRSIGDLPAGHVSQIESEPFLPWRQPLPPSLDRQHSFHGTTTTSLGRQYSNTSSMRGASQMDNCAAWPNPMESVFPYTTFRRGQLANFRRPSSPEVSTPVQPLATLGSTLPLPRTTQGVAQGTVDERNVLPINSRVRRETNASMQSEHDSVFVSNTAMAPNETRQLLPNPYRAGE